MRSMLQVQEGCLIATNKSLTEVMLHVAKD